jgi:predicted PurR-regulated permease PerM
LVVILALVALFLWACYGLRQILIPLTLAFIVAYIFHPLVDALEKRRVPRVVTIAALLALIMAAFAGSLLIIIPRLVREAGDIAQSLNQRFPEMEERLRIHVVQLMDSRIAGKVASNLTALLDALKSHMPQLLQSVQTLLAGIVTRTVGVVGFVAHFLLFAVVGVYLLKDFNKVTAKARELIPSAYKEPALRVVLKVDANLRGFFRGQITVCTILAVIYSVGLSIVGVPFALLIGLVGGYGQIVPYLGTASGIVLAAVLALVEFADLVHPLGAIGVFVVGQLLEGTVISPKIMGDRIGLHPVVIILAILTFAQLLGFLGIILAVPLAAVLKVLVGETVAHYKQSNLFLSKTHDDSTSG